MNFHSYADLWIEPYNYINDKTDKELERKNHMLFEAYQEFNIEAYRPDGAKYGNAAATINYIANGEATDYMLAERNIFAFSPEMGIANKQSNTFYPPQNIQEEIISTDYKVILGFFKIHTPRFTLRSEFSKKGGEYITDMDSFKTSKSETWDKEETELSLFNHSIGNLKNVRIFVRYNMNAGEQVGHVYI